MWPYPSPNISPKATLGAVCEKTGPFLF